MTATSVREWFDGYLAAFAACGRGESETPALLRYYGVPLFLSTDDAVVALTSEAEVLDAIGGQVGQMQAARYERSETLDCETVIVNATSALLTAGFSRRRADGAEIGRLRATYLITDGSAGRRISALAIHGR